MGPGLVGTNTELGFTGTENALYSYAVKVLKGRSIVVPRVTFADKRERHYIISHHTITLLRKLINHRVEIPLPNDKRIRRYVEALNINRLHNLNYYNTELIRAILEKSEYKFSSMGRGFLDDPLFFITAGLAVLKYQDMKRE
jgi:hypothetical protein